MEPLGTWRRNFILNPRGRIFPLFHGETLSLLVCPCRLPWLKEAKVQPGEMEAPATRVLACAPERENSSWSMWFKQSRGNPTVRYREHHAKYIKCGKIDIKKSRPHNQRLDSPKYPKLSASSFGGESTASTQMSQWPATGPAFLRLDHHVYESRLRRGRHDFPRAKTLSTRSFKSV